MTMHPNIKLPGKPSDLVELPYIFDGVNWLIFCRQAGCDTRYDIFFPFVSDGFLYATDGAICLRRPCDFKDTVNRKLPAVHETFEDFGKSAKWQDWPNEIPPMTVNRERCSCRDLSRLAAPADGCKLCRGTGTIWPINWASEVPLGSARIAADYWHRISCLTKVKYADSINYGGMIALKFEGGCGGVMPIAVDEETPKKKCAKTKKPRKVKGGHKP